ncbi:MAG: chemotaxis protein CheW [Thermodesulfobacteriota bacterium]|nr:chemotaxis protein CheW [Thermodesulfobacteriota bacterium]
MNRFGLFQIGALGFAVSLQQIQKILQNSKSYTLPRLPGGVSAVLVDAGQLIPLLDLSQVVGGGTQSEQTTQSYQVLVESEYGTVALPADMTGRIVDEKKGELSTIATQEIDMGSVGKFIYKNKEYTVLDINFLAIEMTQGFFTNPI